MKRFIATILLLVIVSGMESQIQTLRYNDNFEELKNDSIQKKGFDKLKYIHLSKGNRISFGGELREQYQYYKNPNFGDQPAGYKEATEGQVWQRIMGHVNLELGSWVRIFAQANSTFRFFNPNPLTPEIDENQLSLHQAFIDVRLNSRWSTRVGRQEMSYGNNRLITFREGPNTRLAFDAIVFERKGTKDKLNFFLMTPVISKPGISDDQSFKDLVVGVYRTETIVPGKFLLDYYSMSLNSDRRQYDFQGGKEYRKSFGIRFFSQNPRLNYELEANYQYGKFNYQKISAYSASADLNYKIRLDNNFVVGLSGNYFTGDKNANDNRLNTFNPLFSKPQYGLAAPIGASNVMSINPYFRIKPTQKLDIYGGAYFMWRQSTQDGVYSPGATQVRSSGLSFSKSQELGTQIALEASYSVSKRLSFAADAAYFFAGKYVKETGKGKDITYLSFKGYYKF